ncbi:hypothetical protein PIB30_039083 [Stylosanthes scabra]|uniref:Uncharacterized protein n=1 Tax=Stylosanthes scabra TaxID=79078 RepID=A0ABU6XF17_9FABA|nr:hypothetical protein [Stylosanthes scabra]
MGMSYSSVNFRDELVSSSEGEDVLGQERACAELFLEPWRRGALHNLCLGESLLGRLIGLYSDRTNVGRSLYRPD